MPRADESGTTQFSISDTDSEPVQNEAGGAPAEARFEPGTVLAGRYRIVTLVGRGGMGEVYRADDLVLAQPVALKLLPAGMEEDPDRLQPLLAEIKIARRLFHPNLCRVYDLEMIDGQYCLSMEYIDGENLSSLMHRIGRLPRDKATEIALELCAGLEAVHREGILHRDLKLSNLMIDSRGRARILDFGLAVLNTAPQGKGWGTSSYLAPELHAGSPASIRSDLYALGLVLYRLYTGQPAFQARASDPPDLPRPTPAPPSLWVPGLDPEIERILLRCLESDPALRPASALEVADGLESGDRARASRLGALWIAEPLEPQAWDEAAHRHHRQLLVKLGREHRGREPAEEAPGRLLFDHPGAAVACALAYHASLAELAGSSGLPISARVAIHFGAVVADELTGQDGVSWRVAVDGEALDLTLKLLSMGARGQTLLTRSAFDLARQKPLHGMEGARWLAHGSYEVAGLDEPLEVFEVGVEGRAPLAPPEDSSTVHRRLVQETLAGWRPAPELNLVGRRHWLMREKLGEGGFGEVWLAVHRKTGERRVFKLCYDRASLQALKREITVFRLLKEALGERRDIVRILDWNFDAPPYYIESEYTEGGSLLEWVEEQGGLEQIPLEVRVEIVAQAATALAAAHSVGVLHKDIKPANILITTAVDGAPQARLNDFGAGVITESEQLARAGITVEGFGDTVLASAEIGTRLYTAPELLEGKPPTVQSDIYALGVVLYQMVAGDFSHALALGWRRDVPDELLAADIEAAADGSPERRVSSAADWARRLRTLGERHRRQQEEEETAARAAATHSSLARTRRRLRRAVAAVVITTLITLALIAQSRALAREAATSAQIAAILGDLIEAFDPAPSHGDSSPLEIVDRCAEQVRQLPEGEVEIRADLLQILGNVYGGFSRHARAIPLLEEALELRRSLYAEGDDRVLETLNALAVAHLYRGDFEAAGELAQQALAAIEQPPRDTPTAAETFRILADVHHFNGDFSVAEGFARRSLEIREALFGGEHPETVDSLEKVAELLLSRGDAGTASELFARSRSINERLLGHDHPKVASSMILLALAADREGEPLRAEELLREALMINRSRLGEDHVITIGNTFHLATVLDQMGREEEAAGLLRETLTHAEEKFPPDHPLIVECRQRLGLGTAVTDRRPGASP